MIEFDSAKKIATDYYHEHGAKQVSKIREADDYWVFFARKDGLMQCGGGGICVAKVDGTVSRFALPSQKGFALVQSSREILNWEK